MKLKIFVPKDMPLKGVDIPRTTLDVMKRNMLLALRNARLNVTGGGMSKTQLNVRSGRLRSSLNQAVQQEGDVTRGILGSNVIYARIHEEGGIIRPKSRQYLTIPLDAAKTKSGVPRWSAGGLGAARTFVYRNKKTGNLFIMGKVGKDKVVPLFRLVKQVEIPKRPYLRPALLSVIPQVMQEIGTRIVKDAESGKRTA